MRARRVAAALLFGLGASACPEQPPAHEHAADHPEGHDHHAEGHGHGDAPIVRITRWSDRLELFVEHEAAVAGKPTAVLAQLTELQGFGPLRGAEVRVELDGPEPLRARGGESEHAGVYRLTLPAARAGSYRGRLEVSGRVPAAFDGLALEVHPSEAAAQQATREHAPGEFIELLKEHQWGVPFATAFARRGKLVGSIEVSGRVTTPPGGLAEIGAPVSGRVIAEGALPRPGDRVRKGQLLGRLAPAPSSPEQAARVRLSVSEAEARLGRARAARERAERLIADQAISQRELEDARREAELAEAALAAARAAEQLFAGASAGSGRGSWRLVSPIAGVVTDVLAIPGASVAPGTVLFRVLDPSELWIVARVPEGEAARLRGDLDASYQLPGLERFLPIDITGDDAAAALVTIGRTVDPVSRTVDVIYALRDPDPRLRVGGLVRVGVPAGDEFEGVVVPRSALVDDDGRELVYEQLDGEHFAARYVRTAARRGELVGVASGLQGGERIVVRGAHVVRLASKASSAEPHGHIH